MLPNLKNPTNAEGTTVIVTGAFWKDEPDKEKWFPCEVPKFHVFRKLNYVAGISQERSLPDTRSREESLARYLACAMTMSHQVHMSRMTRMTHINGKCFALENAEALEAAVHLVSGLIGIRSCSANLPYFEHNRQ